MATQHSARWIIEMQGSNGKWVRSGSFPKPFFTKEEGDAELARAKYETGNTITYRLRRK